MISCTYLYFDLTLTFSSSGHNILEPSYYNIFFYSSLLIFDSCIIPVSLPCPAMGQTFGEVIYMLSSKCLKQSLLLYSNSLYPYPGPYYGHNSLQNHYQRVYSILENLLTFKHNYKSLSEDLVCQDAWLQATKFDLPKGKKLSVLERSEQLRV